MTAPEADAEVLGPRIGIVRPDRPHRAVADAEARVLQAEIDRRLGPTVVDLRVVGTDLGRWRSADHAAWPADVDVVIDADRLWGDHVPPLTALFARTIEPAAADVRRRMLTHLGVLPVDLVDDDDLAALLEGPARPTDLWLVVAEATRIDLADRRVAAFRAQPDTIAALDAELDRVVAELPTLSDDSLLGRLRRSETLARAERRRADEAAADLVRVQREAADLLDEARERSAVADEQAERTRLDADPAPAAPPS